LLCSPLPPGGLLQHLLPLGVLAVRPDRAGAPATPAFPRGSRGRIGVEIDGAHLQVGFGRAALFSLALDRDPLLEGQVQPPAIPLVDQHWRLRHPDPGRRPQGLPLLGGAFLPAFGSHPPLLLGACSGDPLPLPVGFLQHGVQVGRGLHRVVDPLPAHPVRDLQAHETLTVIAKVHLGHLRIGRQVGMRLRQFRPPSPVLGACGLPAAQVAQVGLNGAGGRVDRRAPQVARCSWAGHLKVPVGCNVRMRRGRYRHRLGPGQPLLLGPRDFLGLARIGSALHQGVLRASNTPGWSRKMFV